MVGCFMPEAVVQQALPERRAFRRRKKVDDLSGPNRLSAILRQTGWIRLAGDVHFQDIGPTRHPSGPQFAPASASPAVQLKRNPEMEVESTCSE